MQPLLSSVVNEGPPAPLPSSPFSPSTGPSSYHFSPPTPTTHDTTLQWFLLNCLQPSVPLFSIMPFQQPPPHFDHFSCLRSLHRDISQLLRTDEGCLIRAVTLTLVHYPQTFLPAFLRSFSHFLLSFSKNPWIPPNSHFLLTGDLFLLFSEEKKKKGCFHSGTPTKPTNICIQLSSSPILLSPWSPICPPVFGCPLVLNSSPSHVLQQASSLFLQTLQSLLFYCLSCII